MGGNGPGGGDTGVERRGLEKEEGFFVFSSTVKQCWHVRFENTGIAQLKLLVCFVLFRGMFWVF